jgi:LysM repeat protein
MLHPTLRKISCLLAFALALLAGGCIPQRSAQSNPKQDPHFLRSQTLISQMDYSGAIDELQRALITNPESAPAHAELAFLYKDYADDPAAAIYHFNNFLELDPETDQSKLIRQNIDNCKMQLAKLFLIAPVVPNVKKVLDQLKSEVKTLKQQNYKLRWQLSALNAPVNKEAGRESVQTVANQTSNLRAPLILAAVTPHKSHQISQSAIKTVVSSPDRKVHTVQNGEYPAKIARRYGIKLEALLKANPRIDPRRLQIGDKVTIPISTS